MGQESREHAGYGGGAQPPPSAYIPGWLCPPAEAVGMALQVGEAGCAGKEAGPGQGLPSHLAPSRHSRPPIGPWAETPAPCTHQGGSPAHGAGRRGVGLLTRAPHLPPHLPAVRSLLRGGPGPGLEPAGAGALGLWTGQVRAAPSRGPSPALGGRCPYSPRLPPGLRSTSCPRPGTSPST